MGLKSTAAGHRTILIGAGAAGMMAGALALIGWIFHVPALTRVGPAFNPMVPNAAIGFLLGGPGAGLARGRTAEDHIGGRGLVFARSSADPGGISLVSGC